MYLTPFVMWVYGVRGGCTYYCRTQILLKDALTQVHADRVASHLCVLTLNVAAVYKHNPNGCVHVYCSLRHAAARSHTYTTPIGVLM